MIMKQNNLDIFVRAVTESRVLTGEQKELFLHRPDLLPDTYRDGIIRILRDFDNRSIAREAYVQDKLDTLYTEFVQKIHMLELSENAKHTLFSKARTYVDTLRTQQPAA